MSAYQDQINVGISKVCDEKSFTHWSVIVVTWTLHVHASKTWCWTKQTDWLPVGGPWPMKVAMEFRPSAISLKVLLHETSARLAWGGLST